MLNDDALDLVNTQNATVRNCFFRTQDDSIAIKGLAEMPRPCAVSYLATGQSQRAVGIDQKIGTGPVVLVGQQKGFCRCWGWWGAEQSGQ